MFGRKKKKIHEQAVLLLRECLDIATATFQSVKSFENINDYSTINKTYFCVIGFCSYYVSGLNKPEVASEMIEIYTTEIFDKYDNEVNVDNLSIMDVGNIINTYYQTARRIADELMEQDMQLEDILDAHAKEFFNITGIQSNDNDISFLSGCFKIFYNETYEKYYGA